MKKWMTQKSFYFVLFVITVVWSGFFAVMGVDFHHDGIMLVTALDVAAGKALFRESFAQYGILTPLLQGAAVRLFGAELIVLRLLTCLFYGGAAVMLDVVWKRFLAWPFRLLTLGMFWLLPPYLLVTFHPWSSVYALFTMLFAAEMALRGVELETRNGLWWFLCGIMAALSFGFRQPCGEVMLLAGIIVLFMAGFCGRFTHRETAKNMASLLGGTGIILALYALYLTLYRGWSDYLLQNFRFVSSFAWQRGGAGDTSRLSNAFFPLVTDDDLSPFIFGILPLISLGLFWWHCRAVLRDRTSLKPNLPLLTLLVFALGAWHQYYPVPCVRHLYWGGVMMFGAFSLVFERTLDLKNKVRKWVLAALLVLALVPAVFIRLQGAKMRLAGVFSRYRADVPTLHGIGLSIGERQWIEFLQNLVRQLPPQVRERGILNCTDDAYYTILLPPSGFVHPMRQNWGNLVYPDHQDKLEAFIRTHRPLILRKLPQDTPCEAEAWLPGYQIVNGIQYMGENFIFEAPKELL